MMKAQIYFKEINPEYDQEYANEYNDGEESESNMKYNWTFGYELTGVHSISIIEDEMFDLNGKYIDGRDFAFSIPGVTICRCIKESGEHEDFAVSKSILNKIHQAKREGYDVIRFYFYINASALSIKLGSNLILDINDVPAELNKPEN